MQSPGCIEVTLEALLGALDPDPTDPEQLKLVAEAAEACDDLVAMVARESPHVGPSREQSVGKVGGVGVSRGDWLTSATRISDLLFAHCIELLMTYLPPP